MARIKFNKDDPFCNIFLSADDLANKSKAPAQLISITTPHKECGSPASKGGKRQGLRLVSSRKAVSKSPERKPSRK